MLPPPLERAPPPPPRATPRRRRPPRPSAIGHALNQHGEHRHDRQMELNRDLMALFSFHPVDFDAADARLRIAVERAVAGFPEKLVRAGFGEGVVGLVRLPSAP